MGRHASAPERGAAGTLPEPDFVPVDTEILRPGEGFEFDLYRLARGKQHELFHPRGTAFREEDRDRLSLSGAHCVYVQEGQEGLLRRYVRDLLEDLIHRPPDSLRAHSRMLAACGLSIAPELLAEPEQPVLYGQALRVAEAAANLALREPAASLFLLQELRRDALVSTHLFNVAAMSVALAARMGIARVGTLRDIAYGGLLHDIGKARVPQEILNCTSPLNEEQIVLLRSHADYGLQLAHAAEGITRDAACMVHQHHERLDGSGYPIGLAGDDLPLASRICGVVDIYDAMTCPRPYREAFHPQTAADYLLMQSGSRLDGRAVGEWLEVIRQIWARNMYLHAGPTASIEANRRGGGS
jgi:HD-GYP domain-containing protein (c-di-GMP phosphodiesterase class II)